MERLIERLDDHHGAWFDATLVARKQSPHQLIEVYDSPTIGKLMRLDGCNMTSERDEFFYHENLVHPAALRHLADGPGLAKGLLHDYRIRCCPSTVRRHPLVLYLAAN